MTCMKVGGGGSSLKQVAEGADPHGEIGLQPGTKDIHVPHRIGADVPRILATDVYLNQFVVNHDGT